MPPRSADFIKEYYGQLVGKTVVGVVKDASADEDSFYGLLMSDESIAWIQSDEEGNGPGFLGIQTKEERHGNG